VISELSLELASIRDHARKITGWHVVAVLATICLVATVGGAAGIGDSTPQTSTDAPPANASAASGGEQFAAIVGAERAAVAGDVGEQRFVYRFSTAETNRERARLLADTHERGASRLTTLEQRYESLVSQRERGAIGKGEYYARLRVLDAQQRSLARTSNVSTRAARAVPEDALTAAGITVDDLRRLEAAIDDFGTRLPAIGRRPIPAPSELFDDPTLLENATAENEPDPLDGVLSENGTIDDTTGDLVDSNSTDDLVDDNTTDNLADDNTTEELADDNTTDDLTDGDFTDTFVGEDTTDDLADANTTNDTADDSGIDDIVDGWTDGNSADGLMTVSRRQRGIRLDRGR